MARPFSAQWASLNHYHACVVSLAGALVLNRYRIVRPFARGSSSVVYLAFDEDGKPYAVKLFHPDLVARADREYLVASRLDHPNLNRAVARVVVNSQPGVLLEFAPGVRLSDWRSAAPTNVALIAALRGLVAGLCWLHAQKLVHRDVKPENIIVHDHAVGERRRSTARLVDFDLAGPSGEVFRDNVAPGTVAFISPEGALGKPLTAAADMYAVGVIMFWALTGGLPFEGEPREVLRAHAYARPDLDRMDFHNPLGETVGALLSKDPAERPDGLEVLDLLNDLSAETPNAAPAP